MSLPDNYFLVSADPGSSGKGWAVAFWPGKSEQQVEVEKVSAPDLRELIVRLCQEAQVRPVLLALDAPIRVFNGVQAPMSLHPYEDWQDSRVWPFDVNPFSQRPCERALVRVPPNNLPEAAEQLATAITSLKREEKKKRGKQRLLSFVACHDGVSVLGYMGAPHAPVVRTFLRVLETAAAERGVTVSYDASVDWQPKRTITVLESHPAVAMAFYCCYGHSGSDDFPECVLKYKGAKKSEGSIGKLEKGVASLFSARNLEPQPSLDLAPDDRLDALVGLLNLLDFATEQGDLFGTAEEGYFLIPGGSNPGRFRDLWRAAAAESRKHGHVVEASSKPV